MPLLCTSSRSAGRGRVEGVGVVTVAAGRLVHELPAHAPVVHGLQEGVGGDDETGRHREPGPGQLAQVGALASHRALVGQTDVREPPDGGLGGTGSRSCGGASSRGRGRCAQVRRHALEPRNSGRFWLGANVPGGRRVGPDRRGWGRSSLGRGRDRWCSDWRHHVPSGPTQEVAPMRALQLTQWKHEPELRRGRRNPTSRPGEVLVRVGGAGRLPLGPAPDARLRGGMRAVQPAVHPRSRERRLGRAVGAGVTGLERRRRRSRSTAPWGCGRCRRCQRGHGELLRARGRARRRSAAGSGSTAGWPRTCSCRSARHLVPLGPISIRSTPRRSPTPR